MIRSEAERNYVLNGLTGSVDVDPGLDTITPMGKLLFRITGAFAEFERHMIKRRVAIGKAGSQRRN